VSKLGIKCAFCGVPLELEIYPHCKREAPTVIIFCDNDECKVKPSTNDTMASRAFEEVKLFGKIKDGDSHA
jgi:hypothetical protein